MITRLYACAFLLSLMVALPTFGMEIDMKNNVNHNEPTYPCDDCLQEKSLLDFVQVHRDGIDCLHILCTPCKKNIESWQKPTQDKKYWLCNFCSYFYHQKNKQCWQLTNDDDCYTLGATNQRAKRFKAEYPDRKLLDITSYPTPNNPTQQDQIPPLHILATGSLAAVICYVAYQAFTYF